MLRHDPGSSQTVRISCQGIRVAGRNTQGVKLIDLNAGDKLVALARVITEQQEAAAETVEPTAAPAPKKDDKKDEKKDEKKDAKKA